MLKKQRLVISLIAVVGVAFASSAVASAATTSTTINSSIGSVISVLTSSGTVTANVTPTGAGAQTIASDTVTVSTNNSAGFTLQIEDTDANAALTSGSDTIPASTGTQAVPTVMSANTWGYRVDGVGGFGATTTVAQSSATISAATFAGVPLSGAPNTIKTTSAVADNDETKVWYGVAADTSQPTGTYTDSVTYTATAN